MKVVLMALDTLRYDHLGCYGYEMGTSPFLDQLAQEGAVFERHYSTDVPTPPAYTAMHCGQRGLKTGIFGFGSTNYKFKSITPMLAQHLAGAGYRTGMVSNLLYVCPWLTKGFNDITPPGLRFQGGTADEVTREAATWLDSHHREDFFLFVHYWDPHVNYFKRAPAEYRQEFLSKDYSNIAPSTEYLEKNPMVRQAYIEHAAGACDGRYEPIDIVPIYDACIRYMDDGIKKLIDHIKALGIDDEVLLIITSDHGESFGEKGFFDHLSCYENISHVPLIIRMPKSVAGGKRINGYSLGTDLMPTILEFCELPVPERLDGVSLKESLVSGKGVPSRDVVTDSASIPIQRMFVRDGWALVHTLDKSIYTYLNTYELFDLSKDKAQETELSAVEAERYAELRLAYDRWLDAELDGRPDLLAGIALRGGGWWTHGITQGFFKNPSIYFENERVRNIIIDKLGPAAKTYQRDHG
jgi:arylsulfatase A-like enzyme